MAETTDKLIPTRATLILRLKDWQDQTSWQDFFDTYCKLIYGVAIRGGLTEAEAQDVVQETLIAVAKHMPTFKYDPSLGSFKGWLLNMTRWRISDQLRKRALHGNFDKIPEETGEQKTEGEKETELDAEFLYSELDRIWDIEWEQNLLKAAIDKARRHIDPEQYQIFDFCVNKGWSPEKTAQTLAISLGQVYTAKHRVAETIRDEVERLKKQMI